jgi:hypothetical protein
MDIPALDCSVATDTVARRSVTPHRHDAHEPMALCRVDPLFIPLAAALIVERVRANQRASRGLTYLFIDPDLNAYVMDEQKPAALQWSADIRGRWRWLVGVYSSSRCKSDGLGVSRSGLVADIGEHLADFDRLVLA